MTDVATNGEQTNAFGTLLQQIRQQAGLTQETLAERAGLSVRGLSDLERGVNVAPRRDTLALLLEALKLTSEERNALLLAARVTKRRLPAKPTHAASVSGGLPSLNDPLIGRDADVAAVWKLVDEPGVRLVTLIGPGGIGKTSLAIAIGNELLARGDAITWVPLASARSAAAALASVAAALGLEDRGSVPLLILLAQAMQERAHLLILDNLEQIPELANDLGRLLSAAPTVSILATSRAPLRLRGERRYQLSPLSLEPPSGADDASPAAALFTRRAIEIDQTFLLDSRNATTVQAICDRLDGLPLAIELAAARSGVLPPAALLNRLERALPLLTGGPRDAPDRQRTLRNAIAWSYELLAPRCQWAFRQLGVCIGGFTLETAGRLLNDDSNSSTLEAITELVEQSLLRRVPDTAPPRFLMLETVREFALEQLEVAGENELAYQRHAAWFTTLATTLSGALFMPSEEPAIRALEAEFPNVRQAMDTLFASPHTLVHAAELANAYGYHSSLRSLYRITLPWYERLLDQRAALPPRTVVALLIAASAAYNPRGNPLGEDLAREAYGLMQSLHGTPLFDDWEMARVCLYLGDCIEDPSIRRSMLEEGLSYVQDHPNQVGAAFLMATRGLACAELGDSETALASCTSALAIQQEVGGRTGIGHAAGHLGHVLRLSGDHRAAQNHLVTAFHCFWTLNHVAWTAQSVEGLASCAAHAEEPRRAAWLIGAATQLRGRCGWLVDVELFGRTPEIIQRLTTRLGEQVYADLIAAGASASWQEIRDFVLDDGAALPT